MESEGDTDRVLHKEAVDAIKKNAMRNEQRITRTLSKNINAPNFNPYIDRARTPSPPLPPGDRPLKRSEQNLGPRKCYNDGNGNIKLLPVAEVDRLMRERMEREKAAQEAAQAALASQPPPPPPPSPPPSAVFNPLLHKKLQRMTEQNIPMKDPYANDDIVQVGDQPEQRAPWKPMKIRFDSNYCLCKQYCSIFPPFIRFSSFLFFFSLHLSVLGEIDISAAKERDPHYYGATSFFGWSIGKGVTLQQQDGGDQQPQCRFHVSITFYF